MCTQQKEKKKNWEQKCVGISRKPQNLDTHKTITNMNLWTLNRRNSHHIQMSWAKNKIKWNKIKDERNKEKDKFWILLIRIHYRRHWHLGFIPFTPISTLHTNYVKYTSIVYFLYLILALEIFSPFSNLIILLDPKRQIRTESAFKARE